MVAKNASKPKRKSNKEVATLIESLADTVMAAAKKVPLPRPRPVIHAAQAVQVAPKAPAKEKAKEPKTTADPNQPGQPTKQEVAA